MTKKILKQHIDTLSNEGSVTKLISYLEMLKSKTENVLSYEINKKEFGYESGEWIDFEIFEEKEETDEQYQKRLEVEKMLSEHQVVRERAEFERLKAKFGE